MTTQTRNEAAERPVDRLWMEWVRDQHPAEIAAFERAERRATVERIVQRWHDAEQYRDGGSHPNSSIQKCGICSAILDEEAAR